MHPAAENLIKTSLAIGIIIITGMVSAFYMDHIFFGILALVVLFLGLGSYFFPTKYGVNKTGVIREIVGQKWAKPWSYFRRVEIFNDGILLSPLPKPSALDKFRGWFLPTKDDDIRVFIKGMMER